MKSLDLFSLIFTVFSTTMGILFSWLIARRIPLKTELTVIMQSTTIFEDTLFPNVAIEINGKSSTTLTKSVVILWNSGFSPIEGTDVVESNMLRVELPADVQIYAAEIERTTNENMKFDLDKSGTHLPNLPISFKHCKPDNGIRIVILHSGKNIGFEGEFKTLGSIKKYNKYDRTTLPKKRSRFEDVRRKLFLIPCMVMYALVIMGLGMFAFITLLSISELTGIVLGMFLCLLGGWGFDIVFKLLQKKIISENGPLELYD